VGEVAKYCYLSTKQLTRIFNVYEGVSPGEYIIKARVAKIKKLISDKSFSLKQISDIMHFNNEYYFNAFFKKHSGLPPGEYRKMLGQ
jgi:AraC-like DNA-binding protein